MSTKIVQVKPLTLSSNIGTSNTTAIVSGMIGLDGVDLTQSDFGTIIYGTFEPNTPREEAVSFTITSNTAGVANIDFGVSGRGLIGKSPYGTGGIAYAHSAGAKLVISNNPNLFNKFAAKDNNETVVGDWTFSGDNTHSGIETFTSTVDVTGGELKIAPAVDDDEPYTKLQTDTALALKANASATVNLTGNQTVAGVKTFSSSPVVPAAVNPTEAMNKSQVEAFVANNSGDILASDIAYGTTKLDTAADTPTDPKALTATANRVAALAGGDDLGTPSESNKFLTENIASSAGVADKIIKANGTSLPFQLLGFSRKLATSTSVTTLNSGENAIATATVPANYLGTNNAIRIKCYVDTLTVNDGSTAFDMIFRLKYGATTLVTMTLDAPPSSDEILTGVIEGVLFANGTTSSQRGMLMANLANENLDVEIAPAAGVMSVSTGTATEDSTGALTLSLTVQLGTNGAYTPAGSIIEFIS